MKRKYPADWDTRRRRVYKRDGYTCQNCGVRGGRDGDIELHAHHIVPKSKGGTHKTRNLITVCEECHDAIHGRGMAPVAIHEGDLSSRIRRAIERHYRSDDYDDGYVRLGKSPDDSDWSQRSADESRNEYYGGCPDCSRDELTVSWIGIRPFAKSKVVECTACSARFDERVEKDDGETFLSLSKIEDVSELETTPSAVLSGLVELVRLKFNI